MNRVVSTRWLTGQVSRNSDGLMMQRFLLRENIARFQSLVLTDMGEQERTYITSLLSSMKRELALMDAKSRGTERFPNEHGKLDGERAPEVKEFTEPSMKPCMLIDPRPGLHIVDINDAYAAATMTEREAVVGKQLFDVFPDNPDLSDADGVTNLFTSLKIAAETRHPHEMPDQRYDVRDPTGQFVERHWRPVNTPIFNEAGQLMWLLHHVEDVTDEVMKGGPKAA